jgi:signal transduction histidine kinase
MSTIIDQTLTSVQRISTELRPRLLDDMGLAASIKWLCEDFRRRSGYFCTSQIGLSAHSPIETVATALFRITLELLTNVARHASAGRVFVQLREFKRNLRLVVSDNGVGITAEQASAPESIGLIGIRERLQDLRGKFSITGTEGGAQSRE